jgi:hypothetical protein
MVPDGVAGVTGTQEIKGDTGIAGTMVQMVLTD